MIISILSKACKEYNNILNSLHFNPIPLNSTNYKFFPNLETNKSYFKNFDNFNEINKIIWYNLSYNKYKTFKCLKYELIKIFV